MCFTWPRLGDGRNFLAVHLDLGQSSRRMVSACCTLMTLLLPACSTIDHFGPRTSRINVETADSRSKTILENVVRSAYAQPLQFSDVSTVTGQGTVSGSLAASLPFSVTPASGVATYSLAPSVSASGTNTFNVVNLNTQEFYNGLQKPISVNTLGNFLAAGYDPRLLLFLMLSGIEIKKPDGTRFIFHSSVSSLNNYQVFYQAIEALVDAGLSTHAGAGAGVGPVLTARQAADPRVLAALLGATGDGGLTLKQVSKKKDTYQFTKKGDYEFCFDPVLVAKHRLFVPSGRARVAANVEAAGITDAEYGLPIKTTLLVHGGEAVGASTFDASTATLCDPVKEDPDKAPAKEAGKPKKTEVILAMRSVEGVFEFLGEMARVQLHLVTLPDGAVADAPPPPADQRDPPPPPGTAGEVPVPRSPYSPAQLPLLGGNPPHWFLPFFITDGQLKGSALTLSAAGRMYSVRSDPSGNADETTRVIQILTDLLAIQSSAKDIPNPSLISVIGR